MDVVLRLRTERGLLSTLDLLAEDIRTDEQAKLNLDTYLHTWSTRWRRRGCPRPNSRPCR